MPGKLYTIGHSTLEQEKFVNLLKEKGVTILVDVRSMPYSKFAPQFNKEGFSLALASAGIEYIHEAAAFGARRTEKELYGKDGYVDFDKVRNTSLFKRKVQEYSERINNGDKVALMCSEKDPLACHRTILVARGFSLAGLQADHILSDGKVMSQDMVDKKLLFNYFPGHDQPSLFSEYGNEDNKDLICEAYAKQNAKVGYKLEDLREKDGKENRDGIRQWTGMDANGTLLSTKDRVASFRGEYGFLSNMHDCSVEYKGIKYGNSEAAYQAQRCARAEDTERFYELSGIEAKKLAKNVQTRSDWNKVKAGIMQEIVEAKFRQNPALGERLMKTAGKELVEGNKWYDTYWGVYNGRGQNMLGEILMKVRSQLIKERSQGKFAPQPDVRQDKTIQEDGNKKDVKRDVNIKDKEFVVAVTGHRPHLLFGYDWKNGGNAALNERISAVLKETLDEAKKQGYTKFRVVTGMALGTDQMFMAQAQKLAFGKEYKSSLVTEAAIPFKGQESKWNEASQKLYNVLLSYCDEKTVVSPGGYSPKNMQARNEYMVDKADIVLSVYDGKSMGGTKNCIDYAVKKNVPVKDIGLQELFKEHPRFEQKTRPSLRSRQAPVQENTVERS